MVENWFTAKILFQIQIKSQTQIQIQIQIHRMFKYTMKTYGTKIVIIEDTLSDSPKSEIRLGGSLNRFYFILVEIQKTTKNSR